jgi:hypothetical protein
MIIRSCNATFRGGVVLPASLQDLTLLHLFSKLTKPVSQTC